MSTWGTGNFDGDGPQDYLDGLYDSLEQDIEGCFEEGGVISIASGEDVLVPAMQIWSELFERFGGHVPEVETVRKWRVAYMPVFEREMLELADENFISERRKVVLGMFDKFETQAVSYIEHVKKTLGSK
jgi:hypothetical protein